MESHRHFPANESAAKTQLRHLSAALVELDAEVRGQLQLVERLMGNMMAVAEEFNATERRLHVLQTPEAMSISAAARYLGVGRTTVYNMVADGTLPARERPDGRTVIRKSDVDGYLADLSPLHPHRRMLPDAPPTRRSRQALL